VKIIVLLFVTPCSLVHRNKRVVPTFRIEHRNVDNDVAPTSSRLVWSERTAILTLLQVLTI
jgi:hypothetical protein